MLSHEVGRSLSSLIHFYYVVYTSVKAAQRHIHIRCIYHWNAFRSVYFSNTFGWQRHIQAKYHLVVRAIQVWRTNNLDSTICSYLLCMFFFCSAKMPTRLPECSFFSMGKLFAWWRWRWHHKQQQCQHHHIANNENNPSVELQTNCITSQSSNERDFLSVFFFVYFWWWHDDQHYFPVYDAFSSFIFFIWIRIGAFHELMNFWVFNGVAFFNCKQSEFWDTPYMLHLYAYPFTCWERKRKNQCCDRGLFSQNFYAFLALFFFFCISSAHPMKMWFSFL